VVDEAGQFLGVVSRTTMLKFLDRDTPPVPPPQDEVPPIQLNPQFPAHAVEPAVAQQAISPDAPAAPARNQP
jgi:glycine betaine/proline transport system ATP-binding protein